MTQAAKRSILRWIHLIFSIPIIGYVYSPFEEVPNYAFPTRYIFLPMLVLGLVDVEGQVVRRLVLKARLKPPACDIFVARPLVGALERPCETTRDFACHPTVTAVYRSEHYGQKDDQEACEGRQETCREAGRRRRRSRGKPSPKSPAQPVKLLSGGNPQIAKAYGDAPVQAYIAAMSGWKQEVGRRLDEIITVHVPRREQSGQMEFPLLRRRGAGLVS